jgi:hypothetical protein
MRIIAVAASFLALSGSACTIGRSQSAAPAPVASPLSYESDAASSTDATGQSEFEYRRHHSAAGRFISADVLAANADVPLMDVLRIHITGFASPGDPRPPRGFNSNCGIEVYVNGLRAADAFDNIQPRDLVGVEYYEASSAPVKYRRAFSMCPVLLLWLKS